MQISSNYLKKLSHWLLPHACVLCGGYSTRQQDLCKPCLSELPHLQYACSRCAKPFLTEEQHELCGICINETPFFDCTHALYLYQFPITRLIMDLKFGDALVNARILGELLADKIQTEWYCEKLLPEALIPLPLHPHRIKQRGFNQALEISRPIAKRLRLPLLYNNCMRIKHTAAQATLPAKERQQNIKNAFIIAKNIAYEHIAVLDDVITTGHTMMEFCRVLKQAGVKRIDVWCCARPVL
ncbi:MAG: ComF family protein [Gammaproteobacteria bacterium]